MDFQLSGALAHFTSNELWLPLGAIVILGFLALVILLCKRQPQARYNGREYLFTKTEWVFCQVLQQALGDRYFIMGKPRIADVLYVRKGLSKSDWASAFRKISSKHVDYLILEPLEGRIVAAIELDDPSHQRKDRQARDMFVNGAFSEAGIPLLRYPTAREYDLVTIRQDVDDAAVQRLGDIAS
ncbi:DUF2726 domain-containing protein [Halomonas sp. 86]|uniref:DUF2726 domain-containing protein n=1 Tax=unclassified Halomonas TaxID=2609666 RepID=UPI004034EEE5